MRLSACLLAGAMVCSTAAIAQEAEVGHPEPDIISSSWVLDFEWDTPKAIAVADPAGKLTWYWFMTYKVTNHTGQERLFVPEFEVSDDTGRILAANRGIPPTVYAEVERVVGNPLLKSPTQAVGRLLQGDDFALESVAIWEAAYEDIDQMNVFVGGLSGETATIEHPDPDIDETIQLRRTRMLTFSAPGFYESVQYQPIEIDVEQDVMR